MGNILSYLKENGHISFLEKEFNEVDALVFTTLSYLKYKEAVEEGFSAQDAISINEVSHRVSLGKLSTGFASSVDTEAMLLAVSNSRRYGQTKLKYYVDKMDEEKELQFAAITFFLEDGTAFLSCRGTDESIVGWKEDFNMAFLSKIPAQEEGRRYLEALAENTELPIRIGGHSKGGNIAVYAAVYAKEETQSRIQAIYSHDGPGFKEDIFETEEFQRMKEKIHKIIPQSSVIGLLLQNQENHMVVKSTQTGILQHDPFSWVIAGADFLYVREVDSNALLMNETLHEWLQQLGDDERKRIVDYLFNVIYAAEREDLRALKKGWREALPAMLNASQDIDEETKQFLYQIFRSLYNLGKGQLEKISMDFIKKI